MRLLLLLIAACLSQGAHGFYEEGSAVIDLDEKTFERDVMASDDSAWIIEFYAPWCGHCKALAPTYEKVAKNLEGLVKVGAVDCDKYPALAEKFGVRGFPTLKTFSPEKTYNPYTKKTAKMGVNVEGGRTAKALVDQALAALPNYVKNVTIASSATFLSDKDYPKAVLLSDKPAPPSLIKSLAVQFKGRMRFGMGPSTDEELAKLLGGVTEFPKLVVVPGDDASKAVVHTGKLKGAELSEFLAAHARKEKMEDPLASASAESSVQALSAEEFEALLKDKSSLYSVFFHQGGAVPATVEQLAKAFKMFKHKTFDCAKHAAVCKEQVVGTPPVLRLYMAEDKTEYEEFTGKSDCLEDCMDLDSMSDFVAESIPNLVVPITEQTWNAFLAPAYERPRVLLFSKKEEPTSLYKSVALNYKDILPFGIYPNPPKALKDQIGLKKIPQLLIFFSPNASAEAVQGMPYQGEFSFEAMTQVLDQFAAPFRDGFDPNNPSGKSSGKAASAPPSGPIPEITNKGEDSSYEKLCASKGGLCAVAFLDGSEGNKDKREEQLKALEDLRTKMHPSPFHMAWVDAVCHSDFAISFEVSQDRVPTVAVISPSKGRYVQHIGKFQVPEMESTLQGVLSGKKQTGPFSSANPLSERDCAEVHAEILAATTGGGSDEDDEIMREMMEEIKRKEAEAEGEDEDDSGSKKKKKKKKKKAKK